MELLVFKFLAKILLMHPIKRKKYKIEDESIKKTTQIKTEMINMNNLLFSNFNNNLLAVKDPEIIDHLRSISESLKYVTDYLDEVKQDEDLSLKWVFAANVMDRLFLIITSLYASITFLVIILINPNVYHLH